MAEIKKILIANRGEIAARVIKTCRDMGIATVAVYSEADATSVHVRMADESVYIGEAASDRSYLNMDRIIEVAHDTMADAIHPGYGFLSENAAFSERCEKEGIIFIGPKPYAIRVMGDKTKARELMEKAGVPLPPGTTSALKSIDEASSVAEKIGYPVLIKAAAGGGGKGMRIVNDASSFKASIKAARSEARNAFGDDRVYIEKYLEMPRHVEFQIIADSHGNICHLYDRECSIQRRHQKVVEEAPCAFLTDELRKQMSEAACNCARSCDYIGAGTVEFLIDKHHRFYFLEMNTRLQVEHPVTELITGVDLVRLQILVAMGKPLPFTQNDISINGHAIESRICAEDPANDFLPSSGYLSRHRIPSGPGIRVDTGVEEGQAVNINYDSLMTKLCVHGETREMAINRMKRALRDYQIAGCRTTIPFCYFVMQHEAFTKTAYDTHFIQDYFKPDQMSILNHPNGHDDAISLASVLLNMKENLSERITRTNGQTVSTSSDWWVRRRNRK